MKDRYATINVDDELTTVFKLTHVITWADQSLSILKDWIQFEYPDFLSEDVVGKEGRAMTEELIGSLSRYRDHISASLKGFLEDRAETDPAFIGTTYDLTFAQAIGKMAEGHTVACRATRYRRYRMVDGALTEIDGEGVAHPVDSFDDEQMGSKWRVAEVDG